MIVLARIGEKIRIRVDICVVFYLVFVFIYRIIVMIVKVIECFLGVVYCVSVVFIGWNV